MRSVLVALVVFGLGGIAYNVDAAQADCVTTEQYVECAIPEAQLPFIQPVPLDCQVRPGLLLRCRINIGIKERWVPGPKPVVKLPPRKRTRHR